MAITLSTNLNTAVNKQLTQPGFLVKIGWASPVYLSSLSTILFNSQTWTASPLDISGIASNVASEIQGQMTIGVDPANPYIVMSYALSASLGFANTSIDIWAYDSSNVGSTTVGKLEIADAIKVFTGVGDKATIEPTFINVTLIPHNLMSYVAPRVRINKSNGFNWLQNKGTRISWGTEVFTLE